MYHDTTFPPPDGRLALVMRELSALDREQIGAAIDAMIAVLDARDGDPDEEDDERGGEMMIAEAVDYDPAADDVEPDQLVGAPEDAEDDDPAGTAEDGGEPAAWIETVDQRFLHMGGLEDAEDDIEDRCAAGDDHIIGGPVEGREWWSPKCHPDAARIGDNDDAELSDQPTLSFDHRELDVAA